MIHADGFIWHYCDPCGMRVTQTHECPHSSLRGRATTLCISCTVDKAEPVECMTWDDECLTCHLTRCRACRDDLADQDAAEAAHEGRWT